MANNTELNPGVGGDTIATDDVGSYKIEKVKIVTGAAGVDGGPVTTSNRLPVDAAFGDSSSLGAFGWLRVAAPQYVFDSQMTYDLQPLLFEQVTSGVGASIAHSSTNRNAVMTFSATPTGGKCYMQQYEHNRYQPGRGQAAFVTGNFIEHTPNCLKWLKYGTGEAGNGVALESNGVAGYQVTLYSGTAEGNQTVPQAAWNLDKLDGTGASRLTLQVSKGVIFFLDLQSLYYGRVRACVDIDGTAVCFHEFLNANVLAKPYIQTANLPISAGMTCAGTVSTTMEFTCCSVLSEGGQEDVGGFPFSVEGTVTAASGAQTHILSIRPKTTFNSIVNRSVFRLDSVEVLVTGTNPVKWELCLGQAITGTTTFNDVNTTYSAIQYNTAGTISGAPTLVVQSGYAPASNQAKGISQSRVPMKYPITLDAAGAVRAMGTLSVVVTGLGGTSACRASLNWKELR